MYRLVFFLSLVLTVSGQSCPKDDPVCRQLGQAVCNPPLDNFGKAHCGIYCEFCFYNDTEEITTPQQPPISSVPSTTVSPDDCGEDDPTCRVLGSEIVCKAPLLDFAKRRCRIFCEFCFANTTDNKTVGTEMTPPPTASTSTAVAIQTKPPATIQSFASSTMVPPGTETPISHPLFEDCNTTAEIVFILDSSSSVGEKNFQQMIEFTQNMTTRLKAKYERVNVTVITFSNDAKVALTLNESVDLPIMLAAESLIPYSHGGTETHKALELMYQSFSHDVKNPKIAVVITDGASFEPDMTRKVAEYAKDHGVAIFAIGIGDDINQYETKAISSDPDSRFHFKLENFTSLNSLQLFHFNKCFGAFTQNITLTAKMTPTIETPLTAVAIQTGTTITNQSFVTSTMILPTSFQCSPGYRRCEWETWGKWSSCSAPCGAGTSIRSRSLCCDQARETFSECVKSCNLAEDTVENMTCTGDCAIAGTTFMCSKADVVFVIDSSANNGAENFQKVKHFLQNMINKLQIDIDLVRVGLLVFTDHSSWAFKPGEITDKLDMLKAVERIPYTISGPITSDALEVVRNEGFQSNRPGVPKSVLLITDSQSRYPAIASFQASLLHKSDIQIYVVGIGYSNNAAELNNLASNPHEKYVNVFAGYNSLDATNVTLRCNGSDTTTLICKDVRNDCANFGPDVCSSYRQWADAFCAFTCGFCRACAAKALDVVFVVDSSGSIGDQNFQKIKTFIKDVIRTFDIGPLTTRVALIEFSTSPRIEFTLNDKHSLFDLLAAVDNITYTGGGTATSDALQLMRTQGFQNENPRALDIAIVITDGLSKFPVLTRNEAKYSKEEGITMFAIGIGNMTDNDELNAIATDKWSLYEVSDYDTLLTLVSDIAHHICSVDLPEEHHTRSSTTASTTPSGCVDLSPDCDSYPKDSCTDFEPYARKACAKTCGYCPGFLFVEPKCEDTINNCEQYGTAMCYDTVQYLWVESHCSKFCAFCGNKTELFVTTIVPTTVITTSSTVCQDELANCESYNRDQCTNPTFTSWARSNCAKYCGFCYNYNYVTSAEVNHIACPAWALPEQCTLEYKSGQCCPFPKCPDGFQLTVERHL